jgi:DNA-binding IclR family transcriptional regulator
MTEIADHVLDYVKRYTRQRARPHWQPWWVSLHDIAEALDLPHSTVETAVRKLDERQLVERCEHSVRTRE